MARITLVGAAPPTWENGGVMSTSLPLVFDAPKRGKPPRHLADLTDDELQQAVVDLGLPKFRANQLARHYYGRLEADAATMTDLPAAARGTVGDALLPELMSPVRHIATDSGTTRKTLWRLHDGTLLESVLMRYTDRATLCISSQAGCGMACPFCATGQGGLDRLWRDSAFPQGVDTGRSTQPGRRRGPPPRASAATWSTGARTGARRIHPTSAQPRLRCSSARPIAARPDAAPEPSGRA